MVKALYEMHGEGASIRDIAGRLGVSRNTVRKYLRASEVPRPKRRDARSSKLDPFRAYIQQRFTDGIDNCVVLLRELREKGYTGGISILKEYVHPFRRQRQPAATRRFETNPGEQAQVDFGRLQYQACNGKTVSLWAFVMVLSWSRAIYVEFIRCADVTSFIRCHVNAFSHFGGMPRRCLYDNAKVVVTDRDEKGEPIWNTQFFDFSLRLGFGTQLCRPYRAQTKGRVESGVKYVKGNFWPGLRFVDLEDLNRQAQVWAETIADDRIHGTTHERPADRLGTERPLLQALPGPERLAVFLRERRKVGRDGYVRWDKSDYGVSWRWAEKEVEVQADDRVVEIWAEGQRIAVHSRATHPGQRSTLPGQWDGLPLGNGRRREPPVAIQLVMAEVEERSLEVYDLVAGAGGGR